jgi:REP element-mobilizing transposase RayT
VDRQPIYVDERDHLRRLRYLRITVGRFRWIVLCYVAMPNHDHLVFLVLEDTVAEGMQYLNGEYAKWMNWRHDRVGHLLQGRYKLLLVEGESYLFELCSYVHLNPVRAGLVERPEDYRWSTYRGYIDPSCALPWVNYDIILRQISSDPVRARQRYRELVERDIERKPPAPWKQIRSGFFLGSDSWVERTKEMLNLRAQRRGPQSSSGRIDLSVVLQVVARATGTTVADLLDGNQGKGAELRPLLVAVAHRVGGHSYAEIASALGYRSRSAVTHALSRFEQRRAELASTFELIARALTAQ